MSRAAVLAELTRALSAIDADDPGFAAPLCALAELPLPDLVREPGSLDGALAALFAGLRRLRPVPVWTRGAPDDALAVRDAYGLEGALIEAPLPPPGTELPRSRGREVYWRVGAFELTQLVSRLPAGVGIVLDAPEPGALPALRRALRGRALGIAVAPARLPAYEGARLDLLVLPAGSPSEAAVTAAELAIAPRTLLWSEGGVARSPLGVIVPVGHAPATALRLTGHRTREA